MADVLGVVIAKSFLVAHRFDPQHHIDDRAEQQGHDITVVILLHFFGFTVGTLRFDLANQTAGAMPLVGGKRFPAALPQLSGSQGDRKSTRLNSSHGYISYAVFCLKKQTIRLLDVYMRPTPRRCLPS